MAEVLYAEVTGSANGVVTSLERLQTTLGTLQTRFSTATTAAGGFANAILGIKAPASAAGLSSLSRSISSIANASSKLQASAPMLGKALSSVSLAVNNMPAVNPESVASITAMGTAFKGLGSSLRNITKYAESAGIALLGLVNSANGLPALNASATKTLSLLKDIAPVAARGSTALSKLGVASERMGKQAYSGGNGLFHLLSMAKRYVITGIVIHMISSISQAISTAMSDSAAWIEDMNYFNVAYGEMAVKAGAYYTNISEALGIDMSLFVKNGAMFEQMAKSLGLSSDAAYSLSTNLMAIGIDLASLTGHDLQDTWDALQSGVIAGQYKPLAKGYGINVTQSALSQTILTENSSMKEAQTALDDYTNNGLTDATIAQTALNEGITESVRNMDPMEKAYLRYKTVLNAARLAQGDMAKTLESPANQTRVFSSAVMGLSRAFGNVMIPILIRVIPYVTAFVSLLATAFNGLAKFFGFKPVDFANTPSLAPVVTTVTDLGDETDKTTASVETLKKSIMGFDQFNILTSNKDASGGTESPSTGGSPMPMDWGAYDLQLEKLVGGKTKDAIKAISDALAPLSESFKKLWDSLVPLIDQLKIFWDTYLVPIGKWILGEGLPKMVDITTGFFTYLNDHPTVAMILLGVAGGLWAVHAALDAIGKLSGLSSVIANLMTILGIGAPAAVAGVGVPAASAPAVVAGVTVGSLVPPVALAIAIAAALATTSVGVAGLIAGWDMSKIDNWGKGFKDLFGSPIDDLGVILALIDDITGIPTALGLDIKPFKKSVDSIPQIFKDMFSRITGGKELSTWLSNEYDAVSKKWQSLTTFFSGVWTGIKGVFSPAITWLGGVFTAAWEAIKAVWLPVTSFFQGVRTGIETAIYPIIAWFGSVFTMVENNLAPVTSWFGTFFTGVRVAIETAVFGIIWWFGSAFGLAYENMRKVFDPVFDFFTAVRTNIEKAIGGIIWWFGSAFGLAYSAATTAISPIITFFGGLWTTISVLFAGIGNSVGVAVAGGIKFVLNAAIASIQNTLNGAKDVINKLIPVLNQLIPGTKNDIALITDITLPTFSTGGFPEDGMFMANHGEMVGKFSNGRTAVANNVQIIEGIKYGVVSAIKSVSPSSGGGEYNVGMYKAVRDALKEMKFEATPVILEGQQIGEVAIKVINKKTSTSGLSPLKA